MMRIFDRRTDKFLKHETKRVLVLLVCAFYTKLAAP